MLIVVYVVVFAVMFLLERLQGIETPVQTHPRLGFWPDSTSRHPAPCASILMHLMEEGERYEG